jgi:hypothetical protein
VQSSPTVPAGAQVSPSPASGNTPISGAGLNGSATPPPSTSGSGQTVVNDGDGIPWLYLLLLLLLLLIVFLIWLMRQVFWPAGGPVVRPAERDRKWITDLPKIATGLNPVPGPVPGGPEEWAMYLWTGKVWLPLREPPGSTFEFRIRIVSSGPPRPAPPQTATTNFVYQREIEVLPGVGAARPRRVFNTSVLADRKNRPKGMGTGFATGSLAHNECTEHAFVLSAGARVVYLDARTTLSRSSEKGLVEVMEENDVVQLRAAAGGDDTSRIEILARSADGSSNLTRWIAHGESWAERKQGVFRGGVDVDAAALWTMQIGDRSDASSMIAASSHVAASVMSDLNYSVGVPGAEETEGDLAAGGTTWAEHGAQLAAGVLGEFPGGSTIVEATGVASQLMADRGAFRASGAIQLTGEGVAEKHDDEFNFEIVNRVQSGAFMQVPVPIRRMVSGEAGVRVFHHITLDVEYDGPPKAWATTGPAFKLEIGEPADVETSPTGARKYANHAGWTWGDARITHEHGEIEHVLRRLGDNPVGPGETRAELQWWRPSHLTPMGEPIDFGSEEGAGANGQPGAPSEPVAPGEPH